MKKSVSLLLILFYFLSLPVGTVFGQGFQSFDDFENYIVKFVNSQIKSNPDETIHIQLLQLNKNMPLPRCEDEIEISLSQKKLTDNSNTVSLQCNTAPTWQLYVPVQIQHFVEVLAAARMMKPGEIISADDVIKVSRDKYLLYNDYYQNVSAIEGLAAARMLPAETVFASKNIKKVPLILRKQSVKLTVVHGSIKVAMQGVAKTNGFMNEQVKIMNPISRKTVVARVTGPGNAEITF